LEPKTITIKGAREHNLQDVSLTLPRNQLICFTGVSGSGKSSLAFDTLFAEGQRRYTESLSAYARQFLAQLPKPEVEHITGLSPAISIQQKTSGWNPRSTVGTITQIHDYLRVLFARVGRQHCPSCGEAIAAQTREQIVARLLELPEGAPCLVLAPVVRGQKGTHRDLFEDMRRDGYARARVDGQVVSLREAPQLAKNIRHHIEIVVDRLKISAMSRSRLAEAVEQALALGDGTLFVQMIEGAEASSSESTDAEGASATKGAKGKKSAAKKSPGKTAKRRRAVETEPAVAPRDLVLSSSYACASCGIGFEAPSPQLFSFNSPTGMCLRCDGLGEVFDFDPELLVPDPSKSLLQLAIAPMRTKIGRWRRHIFQGVADKVGFDLKTPWGKLPPRAQRALLYGLGDERITFTWRSRKGAWVHKDTFPGIIHDFKAKYGRAKSPMVRAYYEKFMRRGGCPECEGLRLNPQARAVRLAGRNLSEVSRLTIGDARSFFAELTLSETESLIAREVLKEVVGRLKFLEDVGLHYLTLDRPAPTLSGGESQRIRLASQIGAGLVGVLYILDEPSIGLHPRDNDRLLASLARLRDMGNTVVVVEHDEQTMRSADHIVDFGPGPGVLGGEVVAQGTFDEVCTTEASLTGQFLSGKEEIAVPRQRRPVSGKGKESEAKSAKARSTKAAADKGKGATAKKKAARKKRTKS
jgi:excinuclease ABC subunit A